MAGSTRDRIKEQARALGYIYNRRAASLRTSRSGIVGVVVTDIMNPFFAEILRSIETELDRSRQTFILSNHYDDLEKQRRFIDTLLQLGADGLIMSPAIGTAAEDIAMIEENGLPSVLIARTVEGTDVPIFRGDDAYGISLATNHLISLGHRRIAMIGGTELLRQMDFLKIIFGPDFTPELYRMLSFGLAMVLVMLYKPRGFVGTREPSDYLHAERKAISGEFTKEGHG